MSLKGFDEDLNGLDFAAMSPEDMKAKVIELANGRALGLAAKNQELIDKNKKYSDHGAAQSALDEAERERLLGLEKFKSDSDILAAENEKQYTDAKALHEQNHLAAIDALKTSSQKELDDSKLISNTFESQLKEIKVDQAITSELSKLEVKKELIEMAHASIAQQTTFTDGKAMIGEKTLSEYMKEWAESPAGKAARLAPNNSGGGAGGSKGSTQKTTEGMSDKDKRAAEINERFLKI